MAGSKWEMRRELMRIFKSADSKGIPDGKLNQAELLHRLSKSFAVHVHLWFSYHAHILQSTSLLFPFFLKGMYMRSHNLQHERASLTASQLRSGAQLKVGFFAEYSPNP